MPVTLFLSSNNFSPYKRHKDKEMFIIVTFLVKMNSPRGGKNFKKNKYDKEFWTVILSSLYEMSCPGILLGRQDIL